MRPLSFLLLGALLGLGAPRRPFSHKYHLTQVATCEGCHPAAAESTRAEDNLLPDASVCVRCHDEVSIMASRGVAVVDKFNHARHVKAGTVAPRLAEAIRAKTYLGSEPPRLAELDASREVCTGCHRGIPESESVPRERAAKAHYPQMADCLVCHAKIDPPESCRACHTEKTPRFRPPSHGPDFKDKHGEKATAQAGCTVCHGRKIVCKECH